MPPVIEHPPVKPAVRKEFNTPIDMMERVAELKGLALPKLPLALNVTPLLGTFINVNKETNGLLKLVINPVGTELSIHAFGACVPTPCDWGVAPGMAFAENVCGTPAVGFTAQYKFNFKETLIVGRLEFGALFVETFDHFIDGSGRADYNSVYIFSKV